jgi:hypothetical protein
LGFSPARRTAALICLADPLGGDMLPAALKEDTMAEAKLAPNLPDWQVQHANRYLASGGSEGHVYKIDVPGRGEITAPALLLTTTGRKSGEKFIFPLFYGTDGESYIIVASKGGAPEHPDGTAISSLTRMLRCKLGPRRLRRGRGPQQAKSAADFGKRRSNFGRLMPTMRSRLNARSR